MWSAYQFNQCKKGYEAEENGMPLLHDAADRPAGPSSASCLGSLASQKCTETSPCVVQTTTYMVNRKVCLVARGFRWARVGREQTSKLSDPDLKTNGGATYATEHGTARRTVM